MGRTCILVVEDEAIVAKDIENRLTSLGYEVIAVVFSGEAAIEKAKELSPDLVLMDIVLKGPLDGIQAAEHLHALDIPVIYLTAHADENTLQRAKVTEPCGYILKPVEDKDLQTTIEITLYKHEVERKLKEREKWLAATLNSVEDAVIAADPKGRIFFFNPGAEKLTGWTKGGAAGRSVDQVLKILEGELPGQKRPATKDMTNGFGPRFENHKMLITKTGKTIPVGESRSCIYDEKKNPLGSLWVIHDLSESKQREEALRKSKKMARYLAEENAIIAEIGRIISSTLDIDEVYERFAGEARKLIPFDRITVTLLDPSKDAITVIYKSGVDVEDRQAGDVYSLSGSASEEVRRTGSGLIIRAEARKDFETRFPKFLRHFEVGLRSMMLIPLISRDHVFGILHFQARDPGAYTDEDRRLAESIANQIAGAIVNARLYAESKAAEEQIRRSLTEKELLLKEIHHRVKNNMQIVTSLLRLQSQRIPDAENKKAFLESMNRIRSMALVHEKLYHSKDFARINLSEYIQNLAAGLYPTYHADPQAIILDVYGRDIFLGIDKAVPCGMILNELISNCLKHAFPGGAGTISVNLGSLQGNIVLAIKDNGVGFPRGLDIHHPESLGLQLVATLVEQLDGAIGLNSDEGTEFRITLPEGG